MVELHKDTGLELHAGQGGPQIEVPNRSPQFQRNRWFRKGPMTTVTLHISNRKLAFLGTKVSQNTTFWPWRETHNLV